jgi:hypothetical protein
MRIKRFEDVVDLYTLLTNHIMKSRELPMRPFDVLLKDMEKEMHRVPLFLRDKAVVQYVTERELMFQIQMQSMKPVSDDHIIVEVQSSVHTRFLIDQLRRFTDIRMASANQMQLKFSNGSIIQFAAVLDRLRGLDITHVYLMESD